MGLVRFEVSGVGYRIYLLPTVVIANSCVGVCPHHEALQSFAWFPEALLYTRKRRKKHVRTIAQKWSQRINPNLTDCQIDVGM